MNSVFSSWPTYDSEEIMSVANVLASKRINYWSGDLGGRFESEFCGYVGRKFGSALSNGTVALEIGLRALGIGSGDFVLVPSRSFVATAMAVANVGARPIFVDIDPLTQCIDIDSISSDHACKASALIVVHLLGLMPPMSAIVRFCQENDLRLIEDCAQAHGSFQDGRSAGQFGDVGCWSFCTDKIISTGGEGGFIACDDEVLANRIFQLKDHGKSKSSRWNRKVGSEYQWIHDAIGSNYRMTEMQSVLGLLQLGRLDKMKKIRRENGRLMSSLLSQSDTELSMMKAFSLIEDHELNFYKYSFYFEGSRKAKLNLITSLQKLNYPVIEGTCPLISRERAFKTTAIESSTLAGAQYVSDHVITLPIDQTVSTESIEKFAHDLKGLL